MESGFRESVASIGRESFGVVKVLGYGGYGTVYLVRKLGGADDGCLYAMKEIVKSTKYHTKEEQFERLQRERKALEAVGDAPFLLHLHYAFQTEEAVYLILDYAPGGDLNGVLEECGFLTEEQARLVIAELFVALEKLHSLGVVHRDVKLDNVLVDRDGHVKLADFGLCTAVTGDRIRAHRTFCGTANYMAPEVLLRTPPGYTSAVDFWAVGVLAYELLIGELPFDGDSEGDRKKVFKKVTSHDLELPEFLSSEAADLIQSLLIKDPLQRLGGMAADIMDVRQHPFFRDLDWDNIPAPFAAKEALEDVEILDEGVKTSLLCEAVSDHCRDLLPGFYFVSPIHAQNLTSFYSMSTTTDSEVEDSDSQVCSYEDLTNLEDVQAWFPENEYLQSDYVDASNELWFKEDARISEFSYEPKQTSLVRSCLWFFMWFIELVRNIHLPAENSVWFH